MFALHEALLPHRKEVRFQVGWAAEQNQLIGAWILSFGCMSAIAFTAFGAMVAVATAFHPTSGGGGLSVGVLSLPFLLLSLGILGLGGAILFGGRAQPPFASQAVLARYLSSESPD
ncbi:MAG TPA: hypothetical protein PLA94_02485 [Myxococcota bacterium]|nr:hypothetical protein [Myxococcota bacterium]